MFTMAGLAFFSWKPFFLTLAGSGPAHLAQLGMTYVSHFDSSVSFCRLNPQEDRRGESLQDEAFQEGAESIRKV